MEKRAVGAEGFSICFYPLHLLVIRGIKMAVGTVENEMVQKSLTDAGSG